MAFLVLAYPELNDADLKSIQSFRKQYDEKYYSVVDPHFTIVFPVEGMTKEDFHSHVIANLGGEKKFDFIIRCATVNKDSFSNYYYVFLVPDEGASRIIKLHDKLYTGPLASHLRIDIEFIPHIGIASSTDSEKCKALSREWNQGEFEISGRVSRLTMVNYENGVVEKLSEFELK